MNIIYLKLIVRNLIKRKSFSLINIFGLALALAVCLIAMLFVFTEWSFDKHIPDVTHKYRITLCKSNEQQANLPYNLKEILEPQLPKGSELAVVSTTGGIFADEVSLFYNQNFYRINKIVTADNHFFPMLGIKLLQGTVDYGKHSAHQMLLSQKTAHTIFGNQNAIGQLVQMAKADYTIVGVFNDLPENTHISLQLILLRPADWKFTFDEANSWGYEMFDYYLKLPQSVNVADVEANIQRIYLASHPNYINANAAEKAKVKIKLQPITDIHLHSSDLIFDNNKNKGSADFVFVFIIIALLILLMAAFNYINLSTAYFQTKNAFSANLKVFGATSTQLYQYIYIQTSGIVIMGFIVAISFVKLLLPLFNEVFSRQIDFQLFLNPMIAGFSILILFLFILLAGLYPAIRFTRLTPADAFKKNSLTGLSTFGLYVRKSLVVAQFAVSITLIIVIIAMNRQIKMMSTQKLGFDTDQLMEINTSVSKQEFSLLKSRLESVSSVADVSITNISPGSYIEDGFKLSLSSNPTSKNIDGATNIRVESNYFDVMGIKQLQGDRIKNRAEGDTGVILSKAAVNLLGLNNAIGEKVFYSANMKTYAVIAVVEDVQYRNLHISPRPIIYTLNMKYGGNPVIRLIKGDHSKTLTDVRYVWKLLFPDRPFEFSFFDEKMENNYRKEINSFQLLSLLMLISIIIAVMGILGLITEMAVQRTKEIGIRKVNGARTSEVMAMLNKDFVIWVVIAFVIATPIGYYAMHKWLQNFAYKTELSWWIFALAGLMALGIALLTVSWQSWKAANSNPVEALRNE